MAAVAGTACQREAEPTPPASAPTQQAPASADTAVPPEAPQETAAGNASAPYPPETIALIERYAAQAQALSAELVAGVDTASATRSAETLLVLGAEIVPAFVERHPYCGPYLKAAMQVQSGWRQMDVATLERDFHKDGALPQVEGDAKTCYHMKDLVVHPATALVLLSQSPPDVTSAQREITEVIAHAHLVKQG